MEDKLKITYKELVSAFENFNKSKDYKRQGDCEERITGVIVFTEDSFIKKYPLESRSYRVASDNKAFLSVSLGRSIFGDSLDGTDVGVRLENYIDVECGKKCGGHVDYCYLD